MGESIRFWQHGELVELTDVPATMTVLQWLRGTRRSLGTKEGCNEGDCGACAVVIGQPTSSGDLELTMAHSCLLLMPMLHGRALLTVEDLARGARLHPVQQAVAEGFATQCGFCTPGIVMSLWRMHERARADGHALTPEEVRVGLAGHVCRCTGYRSIVAAGVAAGSTATGGDRGEAEHGGWIDGRAIASALGAVDPADELDYRCAGTRAVAPVSTTGLLEAVRDRPDARLVGGGTDVVPAVPGRPPLPADWIWTGRVQGFADVAEDAGTLRIGGGASIEGAWGALARQWPHLVTGWHRFASPAVREPGTLAGNLVSASPIGDSAPLLLALDGRIVVASTDGERTIPMTAFVTGYRAVDLRPGEVVLRIEVPLSDPVPDARMFKVARRFDNDIAAVSAAFALRLDGDRIVHARVGLGGVAEVPVRATAVEAVLAGATWDLTTLRAAQAAVDDDIRPMSDHRASADYRRSVTAGLLERWWLQTRPVDPLPPEQTEVWSSP